MLNFTKYYPNCQNMKQTNIQSIIQTKIFVNSPYFDTCFQKHRKNHKKLLGNQQNFSDTFSRYNYEKFFMILIAIAPLFHSSPLLLEICRVKKNQNEKLFENKTIDVIKNCQNS
eukprot:TRINITY_DN8541_c0_g1_i1.p1 TRINITY_DN8541_c0_g1~~TRINITY_DN8541_c0_g1_i1.p1  ORF type:complete len:114 (+),score=2.78 TRINITY_DN8541_c0_g1_i1:220-561(+)